MLYPAQFQEVEDNDVWCDEEGNETYMEFSGGFVVTFRDVPEAITQGNNLADAIDMAQDALRTAMEFYDERGEDYPKPSEPQQGDIMIDSELPSAVANAFEE